MTLRLVYIDDEVELGELMQEFMHDQDVALHCFDKEQDAIEFCCENTPDLVLIDYRLRHMTGVDVARQLPPNIPKILVTGELELPKCDEFQQVISKPFDLKVIIKLITEAVSAQQLAE
ncbi:response regulator [Pseudoalteromonas xiamenensis]|uniref:response regulator n=1 Tax=Pseudoalteromonas xiamenensis TaxID=882626 RepID=UPI0035EAC457